jgi:DNA-binding GntR family transcriptional regulator
LGELVGKQGSDSAVEHDAAMEWLPQIPQQQLRGQVYDVLRAGILKQHFPPGSRLDLEQLESAMGISRTPLKEALQRLEADGLVEVIARRGTYVSELNLEDAIELFELRQVLEVGATTWILERATDEDIERIVALNDDLFALLDTAPYEEIVVEFIERDRLFHNSMMNLTGNTALVEAYSDVNTHLQITRVNRSFVRTQSNSTGNEHDQIVDALVNRDERALQQALTKHIVASRDRTVYAMTGQG